MKCKLMVKMKDVELCNSFFLVKIPTPLVRKKNGGNKNERYTQEMCKRPCK